MSSSTASRNQDGEEEPESLSRLSENRQHVLLDDQVLIATGDQSQILQSLGTGAVKTATLILTLAPSPTPEQKPTNHPCSCTWKNAV